MTYVKSVKWAVNPQDMCFGPAYVLQKSSEEVLSLAVTIARALWTRRNEKRNGKQFMTGFELVKWCGNYIESFKAANSSNSPSSTDSSNAVPVSANAAASVHAATSAISGSSALGLAKQCRQRENLKIVGGVAEFDWKRRSVADLSCLVLVVGFEEKKLERKTGKKMRQSVML
nr:hypothetical protein CFP56_66645 [Quercus suber]